MGALPGFRPLTFLDEHQLALTFTPVASILALSWFQPPFFQLSTKDTLLPSLRISDRTFAAKFIHLSYYDPAAGQYLKGPDDVFIVVFWVMALILLRAVLMRFVYAPLARMFGLRPRAAVRFAEQGWALSYYVVMWGLGVFIMQTSPTRNFVRKHFLIGYPHIHLNATMKWYYLTQTSFWLSQIITLNIEARRKDHAQMFTHHVITSTLIVLSLITNWTLVGNVVMVLMDFVDVLLPSAKMLRYLGLQTLCDIVFAVFVLAWIITRHVLYGMVTWVVIRSADYLPYNWDPPRGAFFSRSSHFTFVFLLLALQVMNFMWLFMILKVVVKVLSGDNATDTRSDSEDSDDDKDTTSDKKNN